jgi:hypothetical protein
MKKPKKNDFLVTRNYNYTVTITDSRGQKLLFRDILGKDLEFIEHTMTQKNQEGEEEKNMLTFDGIISILNFLSLQDLDFNLFPRRISFRIFSCIKEHILCNYIPKYTWLGYCYAIQNGSFSGVLEMEKVPMTKFIAMTQVHKEAVEAISKNPE